MRVMRRHVSGQPPWRGRLQRTTTSKQAHEKMAPFLLGASGEAVICCRRADLELEGFALAGVGADGGGADGASGYIQKGGTMQGSNHVDMGKTKSNVEESIRPTDLGFQRTSFRHEDSGDWRRSWILQEGKKQRGRGLHSEDIITTPRRMGYVEDYKGYVEEESAHAQLVVVYANKKMVYTAKAQLPRDVRPNQ
nr:hypothetical protein LOC_Os03g37360 [Oryza sativa Japonica Group]